MAGLSQVLFIVTALTVFIEVGFLIVLIVFKERVISEAARKIFEEKIKTLFYISGVLLLSFFFYIIGKFFEMLGMTEQMYLIEAIHLSLLLIALLIIVSLIKAVGWER